MLFLIAIFCFSAALSVIPFVKLKFPQRRAATPGPGI